MAASEEVDLATIAAFIDGRLTGSERDRVAKLIGESEAAFEIYAGAVAATADLGSGGESVISMAEHRTPRPRQWWVVGVPAAAAAALLIAVLPKMQERGAGADVEMSATILGPVISPSTARPLITQSTAGPTRGQAELAVALGPGWDEQRWPVMRGGGATVVDSTAALRLGVRATDLQVALVLRDRDRASRITGEMIDLLRSVELSDSQRADYAAVRSRITSPDSVDKIATAALGAEKSLEEFLKSRWFERGKWFAAGEVAARAHSAAFFKSSETRRFLDSAVEDDRLGPEDVRALREVVVLARRGVRDDEFETVRQKFAELIRRHGG